MTELPEDIVTGEMLEQFLISEGWTNRGQANYCLGQNRDHCGGGLVLYTGYGVGVLIPPPKGDPWYSKVRVAYGCQTRESLQIVADAMRIEVLKLIENIVDHKNATK